MKHLELSIQREIDFMIKYNLTADELFIIRMILYAQDGHDEFIKSYFSNCNLGKPIREILIDLQNKGVIVKSCKISNIGEKFNPDDIIFNKTVEKSYLQHAGTLGMELFEAYPQYTVINGKTFSLRNISKIYKSLDDLCFDYGQAIKFNPIKHQEVLELLEYGKDNNLINNGICDFILSRQWELLEQHRINGGSLISGIEMI